MTWPVCGVFTAVSLKVLKIPTSFVAIKRFLKHSSLFKGKIKWAWLLSHSLLRYISQSGVNCAINQPPSFQIDYKTTTNSEVICLFQSAQKRRRHMRSAPPTLSLVSAQHYAKSATLKWATSETSMEAVWSAAQASFANCWSFKDPHTLMSWMWSNLRWAFAN